VSSASGSVRQKLFALLLPRGIICCRGILFRQFLPEPRDLCVSGRMLLQVGADLRIG
jgi:hypothetical protein